MPYFGQLNYLIPAEREEALAIRERRNKAESQRKESRPTWPKLKESKRQKAFVETLQSLGLTLEDVPKMNEQQYRDFETLWQGLYKDKVIFEK